MKFDKKAQKAVEYFLEKLKNKTLARFLLATLLAFFQVFYILLRYKYVNNDIPFWFTRIWGDFQLAPKVTLFLIPLISLGVTLLGLLFVMTNSFYIKLINEVIWFVVGFCNLVLSYSVFRIVQLASVAFKPLVDPLYISLLPSFSVAFLGVYILMPFFIEFAGRKKIVTNPAVHNHPGMVLETPSARGGGLIYGLVFLVASIIFVGINKDFSGLYLSVLMVSILGILDDYQNTHPKSGFSFLENPFLRLFLLFASTLPVIFSGVLIKTVSNPFGGMINLDIFNMSILGKPVALIPIILTTIWVVWFMNVLSWSNGIDGQYPGIVGIASVLVALLALRFEILEPFHTQVATLAAISAGAAFGSVKFNWYPSKIMWGFGAVTAGLIVASLAIFARAKITASVLIILIPFLDAAVTVVRRLLKGKNPLRGDKGHLHHVLMARGWGIRRIAVFYWLATASFGLIGLLSPEVHVFKVALLIAGLVAFIIILLNIRVTGDRVNTLTD
ncbi:MAG: MraY family glycosyltransferase [Patescibacteria group bacterium]